MVSTRTKIHHWQSSSYIWLNNVEHLKSIHDWNHQPAMTAMTAMAAMTDGSLPQTCWAVLSTLASSWSQSGHVQIHLGMGHTRGTRRKYTIQIFHEISLYTLVFRSISPIKVGIKWSIRDAESKFYERCETRSTGRFDLRCLRRPSQTIQFSGRVSTLCILRIILYW